jgi:hypothetical protein
VVKNRAIPSSWVGLAPGDVRTLDLAAAAKRGIIPIDRFRTDPGIVPGPGTVYHSSTYRALHAELKPEDMQLDTTGSRVGYYQALVWDSYGKDAYLAHCFSR